MADDDEAPRIGVSWMQVAASALAAVGTALYSRTLDVSRQQVAAQTAALRRVSRARAELDAAEEALTAAPVAGDVDDVDDDDDAATSRPGRSAGGSPAGSPAGSLAAQLSWKRVAVLAAAVFLVAMVAITAFEVVSGRAVSVYTGGSDTPTRSTVPGLGREERTSEPSDDASPGSGSDPADDPADGSRDDPAEDPSEPTSTEPEPTTEPTADPTPSATPTPSPTPSPGPSAGPTTAPTTAPSSTAGG